MSTAMNTDRIAVWCNNRIGGGSTTYFIDITNEADATEDIVDAFMKVSDCKKGKLLAMISKPQLRNGTEAFRMSECVSMWSITHSMEALMRGTRGAAAKLHPYDKIIAGMIREWATGVTNKQGPYGWRDQEKSAVMKAAVKTAEIFYQLYGYHPTMPLTTSLAMPLAQAVVINPPVPSGPTMP